MHFMQHQSEFVLFPYGFRIDYKSVQPSSICLKKLRAKFPWHISDEQDHDSCPCTADWANGAPHFSNYNSHAIPILSMKQGSETSFTKLQNHKTTAPNTSAHHNYFVKKDKLLSLICSFLFSWASWNVKICIRRNFLDEWLMILTKSQRRRGGKITLSNLERRNST